MEVWLGVLSVVVFLVVVGAAVLLYLRKVGRERASVTHGVKQGSACVLLGLSGAGKTQTFLALHGILDRVTVPSMKESQDTFKFAQLPDDSPKIHVVDVPGHDSKRALAWQFLPLARVIVIVVDAVQFDSNLRRVAELLFDVLTTDAVSRQAIPIIIACNKADIVTAARAPLIKAKLEKELDQLRATRKAVPDQDQDLDSEDRDVSLGVTGEALKWEHLDNEVNFVRCSAKRGDIGDLRSSIVTYF